MNKATVGSLLQANQNSMIEAEAQLRMILAEIEKDDPAELNASEMGMAIDSLYDAAKHIAIVRRRLQSSGAA